MDMWERSLRVLKKYMESMDMETEIEKGGVSWRTQQKELVVCNMVQKKEGTSYQL